MDIERATQLLAGLADGVDPLTGEVLPDDSVCNRAEIVRAFHCILNTLAEKPPERKKSERTPREKVEGQRPENAGKPWTKADDETLRRMFDEGARKQDICGYFKRSESGVAARLVRLGIIESRDEFRAMR